MNLMGIDAGTTGLKAMLFDSADGKELGSGYVEYAFATPGLDRAEIDPEIWFQALKKAVSSALKSAGNSQCAALAISSQGESFVLLDENFKLLRPAIVWLDRRSASECAVIEKKFGRKKIYHTTGDPAVDPVWLGTKLLHLRQHEPEIFKKIAHIMLVEDYLLFRLTGRICGNGALWCSTLLYDIVNRRYWQEMLDFLEINQEQLPEQIPSGVPVGVLLPTVSAELGFSEPPLAVSGGMDQACGALGCGCISDGMAVDNTGTSFNLSAATEKPVFDREYRLPCQLHVADNTFLSVGWSPSGGGLLRWFRDAVVPEWKEKQEKENKDFYIAFDAAAASSTAGANGVVILPHLAGALCPEQDPDAKAVIFGVTLQTTRGDIARAMLESAAFLTRANLDLLRECGVRLSGLILTGGAAKSPLWNTVKASITGLSALTCEQSESGCLGAAILAGKGCGVFSSLAEGTAGMVRQGKRFEPDLKDREILEKQYALYKKIYLSLRMLFKETAS